MAKKRVRFGEGAGYLLGAIVPDFTLKEILVYRLQVTRASWTCAYLTSLPASGSYTRYATIDDLISDLENNALGAPDGPLPPFGPDDTPPDLLVRQPCYVVIILTSDDPTLSFQATALRTQEPHANDYCGLVAPYFDPDGNSRVIYFAVPSPNKSSANQNDPYNMYLQFAGGGADPTPHTIDPEIKNRGPGLGGGGKGNKRAQSNAPSESRSRPKTEGRTKAADKVRST